MPFTHKTTKTPLGLFLAATCLTQTRFTEEWEVAFGVRLFQERVSEWSRLDGARPSPANRHLIEKLTTALSRRLARQGIQIKPVAVSDWDGLGRRKVAA